VEALVRGGGGAGRSRGRPLIFEVSWETCNPVGGIYTVLRSKVPTMVERWRHDYYMIGPYAPDTAVVEFEPMRASASGWIRPVLEELEQEGVRVHHGRWLISGRPRLLLIENPLDEARVADVRARLALELGFDLGWPNPLLDGTLCFGDSVRRLLGAICRHVHEGPRGGRPRPILAHFHEWLGGVALPLLQRESAQLKTVFTTHATQVGRYTASAEDEFYARLPEFDAEKQAEHFGIQATHHIEKACAQACDVMTTVSPITGEECTHLLGRTPDMLTPNGIDILRYDLGADFQTVHAQNKDAIHQFTMAHFFPSQAFDLDRTLYFFTSGRFEPRNKGFDLCLEAMARLNAELKSLDLGVTVVFFIVSERSTHSIDPAALHSRGVLEELQAVSEKLAAEVAERLYRRGAAGERFRLDELADEYWRLRFRRTQHALRTGKPPLLVTHIIAGDDPIVDQMRHLNITNDAADPVKVVYHPQFISPVNPLWGIEYDQFVRGCHLGIFPSVYEPWGYTPLECIAMGVPAITSDLAGFGRYAAEAFPDHDDWGLHVLARRDRSFDEAAADLTRILVEFCRLERRERIGLRNEVESHSRHFGWTRLGRAYHEAHDRLLRDPAGAPNPG
jgi:glycogen(starch) synthase